MLGVRLDEQLEKRLAAVAKKTGRSKSYIARKAIEEKIEDLEDIAMAMERLENSEGRVSFEEVIRNAGLED
jgi:RHH-type rel operon transcriptional repressor/antitoxin RelB